MLQRMQGGRLQKAIEDAGKALDKAHKDVGRLVKRTTDDVDRFMDKRMSTRRSGSCRTPSVASSTPESSPAIRNHRMSQTRRTTTTPVTTAPSPVMSPTREQIARIEDLARKAKDELVAEMKGMEEEDKRDQAKHRVRRSVASLGHTLSEVVLPLKSWLREDLTEMVKKYKGHLDTARKFADDEEISPQERRPDGGQARAGRQAAPHVNQPPDDRGNGKGHQQACRQNGEPPSNQNRKSRFCGEICEIYYRKSGFLMTNRVRGDSVTAVAASYIQSGGQALHTALWLPVGGH